MKKLKAPTHSSCSWLTCCSVARVCVSTPRSSRSSASHSPMSSPLRSTAAGTPSMARTKRRSAMMGMCRRGSRGAYRWLGGFQSSTSERCRVRIERRRVCMKPREWMRGRTRPGLFRNWTEICAEGKAKGMGAHERGWHCRAGGEVRASGGGAVVRERSAASDGGGGRGREEG
eukprot:scaffold4641_cov117-Isochrysis_galbana.AAC.2